ncbi:TetR/AcrR family transcriptional regulator [Variovorax sp. J22R24]|uniref:TetR/AcrR family transcriptional regulator n=1 Tax=Variovorax gracilis TaxID=3053502 RepID=UPI0025759C93|nr:TetR/AcrR family transcriptional regulator [Variovorax sp. J22R24]MDM0107644.1 TetR/AcrR family transcriptional regulator [Variovorax sp. J22R24]
MTEQQRLTDRKREAIVQAAIAEFRANGFDATSVDKVAARAEVSKRTLYNHFPSKDELFAEILRVLWDSSASRMDLPYHADEPLEAQLLALVMQKMALLSDDNFLDLARVAIAAAMHSPARAKDMISRLGEKEGGMLAWIRAAQKDGRLKAGDAPLAVQQLESLVKGVAFWPQVAMGQPKLTPREQRKLAASTVALFLSHHTA